MITHLTLSNVGPAPGMELDFGSRLNLLTGDNGLGKNFLLDTIWWPMTRSWPAEVPPLAAGRAALPADKKKPASIVSCFSEDSGSTDIESSFNARMQKWTVRKGRPADPGLVLYAMADGCFAVWDPARHYRKSRREETALRPAACVFRPSEVWNGLQNREGAWLCSGLIRDWAIWQMQKGRAFDALKSVLDVLSPSEEEKPVPGKLTRISLADARDMPTLRMPYGQDASSGMRRIISLAYLLVWCRSEHLKATELLGEDAEHRAVLPVDEAGAHLHPRWQRTVLPALLNVMGVLSAGMQFQIIAATHSPLIMASAETLFDGKKDAWFDLEITDGKVTLTKRPFIRMGNVTNWLTSKTW